MAAKNMSVFGIYNDGVQAEHGVDELLAHDFRNEDISVLMQDNAGTKDFAHEKHTKAPEGAVAGAGTGVLVRGTLGLLADIGALTIPGLGPFIAAGPIMGALAGAGGGGALGGFIGVLIGMGIPEYEAKRYEGMVRSGGILLSVHCDNSDWVKHAKNILERTGARDIASSSEASSHNPTDKPRTRYGGSGL